MRADTTSTVAGQSVRGGGDAADFRMRVFDHAVQTGHRFGGAESHKGARGGDADAIVLMRQQRQHDHVGLFHTHFTEQRDGITHDEPATVAHEVEQQRRVEIERHDAVEVGATRLTLRRIQELLHQHLDGGIAGAGHEFENDRALRRVRHARGEQPQRRAVQQPAHDALAAESSTAATDGMHMLHRGTRDRFDGERVTAELRAVDELDEQITGGQCRVISAGGGETRQGVGHRAAARGAGAGPAIIEHRRTGGREPRALIGAGLQRRYEDAPQPQQLARAFLAADRTRDRGGRVPRQRERLCAGSKRLREQRGKGEQLAGSGTLTDRDRTDPEGEGASEHPANQRIVDREAPVEGDALEHEPSIDDPAQQRPVARTCGQLTQGLAHERLHHELGINFAGCFGRAERLDGGHPIDQHGEGPEHGAGRTAVGHRPVRAALGRVRVRCTASVAKGTHRSEVTK